MKFESINRLTTNKGCVIWITGLSGAGKTSLAIRLEKKLKNIGVPTILIDGDNIRNFFLENKNENDYNNEARKKMAVKYSQISSLFANQGYCVITSVIGMFKEIYNWNKKNLPGYYEVFLDIPIQVLKQRDSKGIYKKYELGRIRNVAGLDLEIQKPDNPNLHVRDNSKVDLDKIKNHVINKMYKNK